MRNLVFVFAILLFISNVFALTTVVDVTINSIKIPSMCAYLEGADTEALIEAIYETLGSYSYYMLEVVSGSQTGNIVVARRMLGVPFTAANYMHAGQKTRIAFNKGAGLSYSARIVLTPYYYTRADEYDTNPYSINCTIAAPGTTNLVMGGIMCSRPISGYPSAAPCTPPGSAGPLPGASLLIISGTNCTSDYEIPYPGTGYQRYCFFLGAV